ncbi:MAG: transcription elongation factor GreA [Candidatus Moranbacteria bacterium]|jgi:transcription elongation factor GreA|nr:transcription elongation factor GreA [Candidatus Moranbacteria bacterium]
MSRIYTEEGLKKLETELEERKTMTRIAIAQAIKEAKEQGDLSENAEYSEAKRQQDENENRIMELETLLRDAILADTNTKGSEVGMGSKLTVKLGSKELAFEIVGSNEVDPAHGKISNESPLGKAFMGQQKGDKVEVQAPAGKIKYEILDVK